MFVVKNRIWFFVVSTLLVVLALVSFFGWGMEFGIEYKGGSIAELNYPNGRPDQEVVKALVNPLSLGGYVLQPTGDTGYVLKTKYLGETERADLMKALQGDGKTVVEEKGFRSVGPVIGSELKRKALTAIVLVIISIVLFISFAFRKVSEPVASWKYGIVAIIALIHDIAIPAGVMGLLVHFRGAEIDILFTTALLAILGLSINDTIVVFDRIRENLRNRGNKETFEETVGKSLKETYARSFNTSFTVILVLLSLFLFGGDTTQNFALILLVGMIAGTYSSIFLASPMLVTLKKLQDRKAKN